MIEAIIYIFVFLAGIAIGGFGALKCVKFGIRASYEIRNGTVGLVKDDADAEIKMLEKRDKDLKK